MKTKQLYILLALNLVTAATAVAQGTFQDLNFEEANIIPIAGKLNAVTVANALPGWTVDYGDIQQSEITYNVASEGGTTVTVLANGYPTLTGATPLDGNYSVDLYGGATGNDVSTPVSISQTGQIPLGTQSLIFEGTWDSLAPQPNVSIGSDVLTLFPVGGEYFAANISGFAGQTEQLTITVPGAAGNYIFDDISFSPSALTTPEPDALTLMSVGGLLFGLYRCFTKKLR